jgi:hypothetical protein
VFPERPAPAENDPDAGTAWTSARAGDAWLFDWEDDAEQLLEVATPGPAGWAPPDPESSSDPLAPSTEMPLAPWEELPADEASKLAIDDTDEPDEGV